ncbi:hypothetical protein GGX14DRAFT_558594 [Mycena pura]|uniref:Uncharacterized protein n=1 Tax=Mycena pura TaxID=153505 RepID=A0AAD6YL45_9AGAR|nr:hypothetical protein GGX14DRAFT_558594 [Mycena pura]
MRKADHEEGGSASRVFAREVSFSDPGNFTINPPLNSSASSKAVVTSDLGPIPTITESPMDRDYALSTMSDLMRKYLTQKEDELSLFTQVSTLAAKLTRDRVLVDKKINLMIKGGVAIMSRRTIVRDDKGLLTLPETQMTPPMMTVIRRVRALVADLSEEIRRAVTQIGRHTDLSLEAVADQGVLMAGEELPIPVSLTLRLEPPMVH